MGHFADKMGRCAGIIICFDGHWAIFDKQWAILLVQRATLLAQFAILLVIRSFFADTMDHLRSVNKRSHSHSILRMKLRIFGNKTFQIFSNSVMFELKYLEHWARMRKDGYFFHYAFSRARK
jgi:hypothetical protein